MATSATVEAQNAALAMQQTRLEELTKFLAAVGEKSGLSLPPELLHPLPLPVPVLPTPVSIINRLLSLLCTNSF